MALEHLIQAELHHWLYYCIPDSDKTQSYALQTLQLGENVSVTLKLHYIQYIRVRVCTITRGVLALKHSENKAQDHFYLLNKSV